MQAIEIVIDSQSSVSMFSEKLSSECIFTHKHDKCNIMKMSRHTHSQLHPFPNTDTLGLILYKPMKCLKIQYDIVNIYQNQPIFETMV